MGSFVFPLKQWKKLGILGWTRCWGYSCLLAIFGDFYCFCGLFFLPLLTVWNGGFAAALAYSKAPANSSHWQTELVIANIDTGWACAHGLSYVNTTALLVTALAPCFFWKWLTRLNFQEVLHSLGILTLTWLMDGWKTLCSPGLLHVDADALCFSGAPGGENSCEKALGISGSRIGMDNLVLACLGTYRSRLWIFPNALIFSKTNHSLLTPLFVISL